MNINKIIDDLKEIGSIYSVMRIYKSSLSITFMIIINKENYFINLEEITRGNESIFNLTFAKNKNIIENEMLVDIDTFIKIYDHIILSIKKLTYK